MERPGDAHKETVEGDNERVKVMYSISIIISAYNEEKYINRALRSCLSQSLPRNEYEIIVVNDGSMDKTGELLQTFAKFYQGLGFIKVITLDENKGLSFACNEGIKQSLGQYIVRVDGDDYINEKMLEIEELFLNRNKDFDAVACDYLLMDNDENIIKRGNCDKEPIACGIMFRKDRLVDIGLYNEKLRVDEDKDLRERFLQKYNINRIALPLYRYRKHKGSLSNP